MAAIVLALVGDAVGTHVALAVADDHVAAGQKGQAQIDQPLVVGCHILTVKEAVLTAAPESEMVGSVADDEVVVEGVEGQAGHMAADVGGHAGQQAAVGRLFLPGEQVVVRAAKDNALSSAGHEWQVGYTDLTPNDKMHHN